MNHLGEDDYIATWRNEANYYYNNYGDGWDYGCGGTNYMGNHMMLLDCNSTTTKTNNDIIVIVPSKRDQLKSIEYKKPTIVHNKYPLLTTNGDDNDNGDGTVKEETEIQTIKNTKRTQ